MIPLAEVYLRLESLVIEFLIRDEIEEGLLCPVIRGIPMVQKKAEWTLQSESQLCETFGCLCLRGGNPLLGYFPKLIAVHVVKMNTVSFLRFPGTSFWIPSRCMKAFDLGNAKTVKSNLPSRRLFTHRD